MIKRAIRMKKYIPKDDFRKHINLALKSKFNMHGQAKLDDPFRSTNGFITD